MSQVVKHWVRVWRRGVLSTAEQVDGCYQGARLYEANDECTEDEAEAGQVLLLGWYESSGGSG